MLGFHLSRLARNLLISRSRDFRGANTTSLLLPTTVSLTGDHFSWTPLLFHALFSHLSDRVVSSAKARGSRKLPCGTPADFMRKRFLAVLDDTYVAVVFFCVFLSLNPPPPSFLSFSLPPSHTPPSALLTTFPSFPPPLPLSPSSLQRNLHIHPHTRTSKYLP